MQKFSLPYLGERIKEARLAKHLTQDQLSEQSDISKRHLAGIEHGKINASAMYVYQLISVLQISADVLFFPDIERCEQKLKSWLTTLSQCNIEEQEIILNVAQTLTSELLAKQKNMENTGGLRNG